MAKRTKNKTRRGTDAKRFVYRIRHFARLYEPDARYGLGGKGYGMLYVRLWINTSHDGAVTRQQVEGQRRAIVKEGGHSLLGMAVQLLVTAADLPAVPGGFRGYLINHLRQPAGEGEIAEMLGLSVARTRWALRALMQPRIAFLEKIEWVKACVDQAAPTGQGAAPVPCDDADKADRSDGTEMSDSTDEHPKATEARAGPEEKTGQTGKKNGPTAAADGRQEEEQEPQGAKEPDTALPCGNAAEEVAEDQGGCGCSQDADQVAEPVAEPVAEAQPPGDTAGMPPPTRTGTGEAVAGCGKPPSPTHPDCWGQQQARRGGPCGGGGGDSAGKRDPTRTGTGEVVAGCGKRPPSPSRPDFSGEEGGAGQQGGDGGDGLGGKDVTVECDLSDAVTFDVDLWDRVAALTEPASWPDIRDDATGRQFAKAVYYLLGLPAAASVRAADSLAVPQQGQAQAYLAGDDSAERTLSQPAGDWRALPQPMGGRDQNRRTEDHAQDERATQQRRSCSALRRGGDGPGVQPSANRDPSGRKAGTSPSKPNQLRLGD